ncbi:hypothetical protein JW824_08540 [bacterium]|nr:hypothetical protein [bacterium]
MFINESQSESVINELISIHGESERTRIERGVRQVARFWREEDGNIESFSNFCKEYYIADPEMLQKTVDQYEHNFESVLGHLQEVYRELSEPMHLDIGPMLPVDMLFAEYAPTAHVTEDFFKNKIAFVALLNFPLYTLEERLERGLSWSREEWAQARLVENFYVRVPSEVEQEINRAYVSTENYINNYNIYMHHVIDENGQRLFPPGLILISHWGLRDELKAQYAKADGLVRQETIQQIMENIIQQEIPQVVINNPAVDWNLATNGVAASTADDVEKMAGPASIDGSREPDQRYAHLFNIFRAEKLSDPYYPTMPTKMDRTFQHDREIPEETVEALFQTVLSSPVIEQTARLIEKRLGRPLRPFDIWYNGFKSQGGLDESRLDQIVSDKYPSVGVFQSDLPNILQKVGFSQENAAFLASKISVDPARGAGHAMSAGRRVDNAHLRTRVPSDGMNYKGYNIAMHELGHNCEQVFSLNRIDHTLLRGVPNTAFTEAFAFIFQARDLDLLNVKTQNPEEEYLETLDILWSTYEIGGVSLVDMQVWHWMYDHPEATPSELKEAVIQIAKDVWNRYYAPVFGVEDVILLGVYSHMIAYGLYLPDYPLGFIISFQIEQYLKDKNLGTEMERMCTLGSIIPDAWMQAAVGESISVEPLLKAAEEAIAKLNNL